MAEKLQHEQTLDKGGRVKIIALIKKKGFLWVNGLTISRAPQLGKSGKPFCATAWQISVFGFGFDQSVMNVFYLKLALITSIGIKYTLKITNQTR